MSVKSCEKLDKSKVALTIEADAAAFEAAINKAYLQQRSKISVPGFRPGKAPRKMIESMYGAEVFYEEAVNILLPDAYEAAVKYHAAHGNLDVPTEYTDEDGILLGKWVSRQRYAWQNPERSSARVTPERKALLDELADDSNMVGEFLITDSSGNYIVSTAGVNAADLEKLEEMNRGQEASGYGGDLIYHGEEYLMYKGVVSINDWQIYILKSKAELLDSVGRLRMLIIWLSVVMIAICLLIVLFLSRQMTSSLQRLALQMNRMRNGELEARYYYPYKDEIGSLAKSFNYMADQVEQSMKKQEEYIAVLKEERDFVEQAQKQKRKAELQALQAQINPHFLYNTLNTITWLASEQGMNEVRILSNALGKFFRIGLSRGAEVIPVKDELEHVKSYLTIQEIRYAEVMEYTLDVPEELWPCTILKLVLQPLVENSIYHGIKEKNGKGRIVLRAREEQSPDGSPQILFTVEDTGVGMSRDKVESINRALEIGTTEHSDGYGIFNVNERIKLYYGEGYGLHYESCEGEWTRATLTIPKCMQEKDKCTEY